MQSSQVYSEAAHESVEVASHRQSHIHNPWKHFMEAIYSVCKEKQTGIWSEIVPPYVYDCV